MASKKHIDTVAELNKPYEENEIQLKGIFSFGVGLLLLIIVTFGLMWMLLRTMEDYLKTETVNPVAMSDKEKLPPEPRLQGAPGFGVDSDKGRINLELSIPQAEYRELKKQWDELLKKGRRDARTGMVSVMPIDEAKEKFLARGVKAKSGPEAEAVLAASRQLASEASSGRTSLKRR